MCELVKRVAKSRSSNLKLISQSEDSFSSCDLYIQDNKDSAEKQSRPEIADKLRFSVIF